MAAWKILLTDGLEENGQASLHQSAQVDDRNGISPEELLQLVGEYDAMIVGPALRRGPIERAVLSLD